MRTLGTIVLLLVGSCQGCDEGNDLDKLCEEQSCWLDDLGQPRTEPPALVIDGITPCRLGVPICSQGEVVGCDGWQPPLEEECNGIDDDCDSVKDDNLALFWYEPANPCPEASLGICKLADWVCRNGVQFCDPATEPYEERCDGLDTDCDGAVDDIATQFVYPEGPGYDGTMGVGECNPGVIVCIDGEQTAYPPDLPSEERCGTNRDEDCDGFIDEDDDGRSDGDFALAIDISTSMREEIEAVQDAVCAWAEDPYSANARFAILLIGDGVESYPFVSVVQDFADVTTTCEAMAVDFMAFLGANEYQLSALILAQTLSWSPERLDRNVLIFTDEPMFLSHDDEFAEAEETCLTDYFEVGVFADPAFDWMWEPLISTCGGFVDTMDPSTSVMFDKLHYHYYGKC